MYASLPAVRPAAGGEQGAGLRGGGRRRGGGRGAHRPGGYKEALGDTDLQVAAKIHCVHEAEAEQLADVDEMLVYMDEGEEPEPYYAPIYPAPGTDILDTSDDEA